ncbi:MAG: YdcF family protein [Bacillota bacterium]
MLALEKIIASLLMPPGLFILLLFVLTVYLIIKGKSGFIKIISVIFLLIMIILSSGIGIKLLLIPLENYADEINVHPMTPRPVVVLGGGIYHKEDEGAYPGLYSLQRIVRAYRIYNLHGTEMIYSGGIGVGYSETSESEIAAQVLENMGMNMEDYIEENRARTTFENAEYIKQWMDDNDYDKIYLVTSAVHMARSAAVFKKNNIDFLPVHSGYIFSHRLSYLEYLPSRGALTANLNALHEWIGLFWYYLTDRI